MPVRIASIPDRTKGCDSGERERVLATTSSFKQSSEAPLHREASGFMSLDVWQDAMSNTQPEEDRIPMHAFDGATQHSAHCAEAPSPEDEAGALESFLREEAEASEDCILYGVVPEGLSPEDEAGALKVAHLARQKTETFLRRSAGIGLGRQALP
ncbi:MAG: hypothetical protein K6E40_14955 [Desulfovibrio sp.]|nr:hypothetical protein [Desulfovibrio sp.]